MTKIEVLFPEICNLYGDLFNVEYLKESIGDSQIIKTSLKDEPLFVKEIPDMIYMGTMTESSQLLVIEKLSMYKERIIELINSGANFFITGNALEIFADEIYEEDELVAKGLGIFPVYVKRNARNRYNSLYVGDFSHEKADDSIKIVGFKSLFGLAYYKNEEVMPLFNTSRGYAMNKETFDEGIRKNNFFATYITGPFMVVNPVFAKWYINNILNVKCDKLSFEDVAMDAYESRVKEFTDPKTGIYYS